MGGHNFVQTLTETVYRYSHLYMPKNAQKRKEMIEFNRKIIDGAVSQELETGETRERKRKFKELYKKFQQRLKFKSQFANPAGSIEPYLFLKMGSADSVARQNRRWLLKP